MVGRPAPKRPRSPRPCSASPSSWSRFRSWLDEPDVWPCPFTWNPLEALKCHRREYQNRNSTGRRLPRNLCFLAGPRPLRPHHQAIVRRGRPVGEVSMKPANARPPPEFGPSNRNTRPSLVVSTKSSIVASTPEKLFGYNRPVV